VLAPWPARLACDARVQALLAVVAVALAVAVGAAWGRRRGGASGPPAATMPALPEAHPVWDSWRAARDGDVAAYLSCFAPPARAALEAELSAVGREAFAQELRRKARAALAVELGRPRQGPSGRLVFPVAARGVQAATWFDYAVERREAGWKIAEIVPRGQSTATPPYAARLAPQAEEGDER